MKTLTVANTVTSSSSDFAVIEPQELEVETPDRLEALEENSSTKCDDTVTELHYPVRSVKHKYAYHLCA